MLHCKAGPQPFMRSKVLRLKSSNLLSSLLYICLYVIGHVLSYNPPRVRVTWYHIAGNFHGRKLFWIGGKYYLFGETFTNCLLVPLKDATPLNFTEKTSANSHKTSKFAQVFSLESFPLYGRLSFSPKTKNGRGLGMRLASFPGPAQFSVACSTAS